MEEIEFLTLSEVLEIHLDQMERYGGAAGVRDLGLLQSAIAMPEAAFGGKRLHTDLFEMAAAYAFHICRNHPFHDGNKRTALACALIFLDLHGIPLDDPEDRLYDIIMAVVLGKAGKKELAAVFRDLADVR